MPRRRGDYDVALGYAVIDAGVAGTQWAERVAGGRCLLRPYGHWVSVYDIARWLPLHPTMRLSWWAVREPPLQPLHSAVTDAGV